MVKNGHWQNGENYHMIKVLIIEDDTDINNLISEALTKAGYTCTQAFSGTEGLLCIDKDAYALVLLDLMLPGKNGEALLPLIKQKQNVPVIVVSAKDSLDSKVALLTSGAEDYMTKPFEVQELVARVGVQIRRYSQTEQKERPLRYKDLSLHAASYSATVHGHEIMLTRQEFKIMELLLSHPQRVFSKQDIYDYAWDDTYMGEDKTINVHISNIRKKIKAITDTEYIETVWGIGFRLAK